MKLILNTFLALFLLYGLVLAQSGEGKYGSEITLAEKTKILAILEDPESYIDQVVLIEGEVLDVCPKMGCWMELKSEVEGEKIKVKVEDGEIVFPMEAIGSTALVEGKVYKIELSQEDAIDYYKHIAEESNKEFDPSTVTGPMTIYQIKGLAAEIYKNEG